MKTDRDLEIAIKSYREINTMFKEGRRHRPTSLLFNNETYDIPEDVEERIKQIVDTYLEIIQGKIPESYPKFMVNEFDIIGFRGVFIKEIGFSLVSTSWIKPLAKWIGNRKVLEVMSGCGSLSYALKQEGVEIIATDNFSWKGDGNSWNKDKKYWSNIENIDCVKAVKKYSKDVDIIIMSWPYMDDNAYKVLLEMRKQNPDCVLIYIGEGYGGCTADDQFHEAIYEKEIDDESFDEAINNYQQWFGIHDFPILVK